MNNKGFTLIELIAIMVILVLIFFISFPQILNITKTDEEKKYNNMVDNLCIAGKSYISANIDDFNGLTTIGNEIELTIQELMDYGNVDKNIKNPKTNNSVMNDVLVYSVLSDYSLDCKYIDNQNGRDIMLEVGQLIKLDNNKEYIVVNTMDLHSVRYVFLVSNTKPLEIVVANEKNKNGSFILEEVKDNTELDYVLSQFALEKEDIEFDE